MTREVKLRNGDLVLVDDDDYDKIISYGSWFIQETHNKKYARCNAGINGKNTIVLMHRFILNLGDKNSLVDHIDGNGLNNQKNNLRIVSITQNNQNTSKRKHSQWPYKGVRYHKNSWCVRITVNGKRYERSGFPSPEVAAIEYDRLAKQYFGEYARTNFLD